jgi:uncharacterized protein YpmS
MKFAHLLALTVVLATGIAFSLFAADEDQIRLRYVEVKTPFTNIYVTNTDPKSDIIRQTKKGEYLELLSEGKIWYKVRVDGKDGFLEAKAGRVVDKKNAPIITLLLYILILLVVASGVILFLRKSQVLTR